MTASPLALALAHLREECRKAEAVLATLDRPEVPTTPADTHTHTPKETP